MKYLFVIVFAVFALTPSLGFAHELDGVTIVNQHLDSVILRNSNAINCTITNAQIIQSTIADSTVERSSVDSSSVTASTIRESSVSGSSITQTFVERSTIKGGSAVFFSTMADTTINGGILRDTYGEGLDIHSADIQRSEVKTSKILHASLKDSLVTESYLDSIRAEDTTLEGVVIQHATLMETFVEDGWLDFVASSLSTFMNANVGNAELQTTALCKTFNRDTGIYYGECKVVAKEERSVPFVGMYLVYKIGDYEAIRHNVTNMVDANTIAVATSKPIVTDNTVVGYDTYTQEINANSRLVESTSRTVEQGLPGEIPQGEYTDLWIPRTTSVGDYVSLSDDTFLVGQESDDVWYVGNHTNETTFGARMYHKETGLFLGVNHPTPVPLLKETNAFD